MKKTIALLLLLGCSRPIPEQASVRASTATAVGPVIPTSWTVPQWYVDPANSSGNASDNNNCTTTTTPCLTWHEINDHRWGCLGSPGACPRLRQVTSITGLSQQSGTSDPIYLTPAIENGGSVTLQGGSPTIVATGVVLSGTIQKNKTVGSNSLLITNLGASGAVKQLVENTTHPSRAWVYKSLGANSFSISQPMTKITVGQSTAATEVNTWTDGDLVNLLNPIGLNVVKFEPTVADFPNSGNGTPPATLYQLKILDPAGPSTDFVYFNNLVALQEVVSERAEQFTANDFGGPEPSPDIELPQIVNVNNEGSLVSAAPIHIFAGIAVGPIGVANIACGNQDCDIGLDTIFSGFNTTFHSGGTAIVCSIYMDTNITALSGSIRQSSSATCGDGIWYGAASKTIHMNANTHFGLNSGTFVAKFTAPGLVSGITLDGSTTACSHTNASPDVINCGITLNPTNLDAAAGVSGFGGNAFIPGGASMSIF